MRLTGLKSQAQRLAWPKQVLLTDHLIRCLGTKLLGKRGIAVYGIGKQIAQSGTHPARRPHHRGLRRVYPQSADNPNYARATVMCCGLGLSSSAGS